MSDSSVNRAMTLRLTTDEYAMLERRARQAGLKPAAYARSVIKYELGRTARTIESQQDVFLRVVRELEALSQKYSWPEVDVVKLIRADRLAH